MYNNNITETIRQTKKHFQIFYIFPGTNLEKSMITTILFSLSKIHILFFIAFLTS